MGEISKGKGLRAPPLPTNKMKIYICLFCCRLKELELNRHSQLSEIAFLKFFASQTSLECIKIYKCHHFSLKCFLTLLQNCSNLKVVKVECFELNVNFLMGKEILHALILLPHLKILKLKGLFFMEENVNANRAAPVSATAFQCLQELTLKMPVMYFDIFSPKIHSNLSVLHVVNENGYEGLKDVNLQLIFKKWVNYSSLSPSSSVYFSILFSIFYLNFLLFVDTSSISES